MDRLVTVNVFTRSGCSRFHRARDTLIGLPAALGVPLVISRLGDGRFQ